MTNWSIFIEYEAQIIIIILCLYIIFSDDTNLIVNGSNACTIYQEVQQNSSVKIKYI